MNNIYFSLFLKWTFLKWTFLKWIFLEMISDGIFISFDKKLAIFYDYWAIH